MNKEYILPCTIVENKLLASELENRYDLILEKVVGTIMDLAIIEPNPKDFLDPKKAELAHEQHLEWVTALSSVYYEITQMLFKIRGLDGNGLPKNEEAISAESV